MDLEIPKSIETVLSMLKEKDEEIESLKEIKKIADSKITDLPKMIHYDELKSEIWILQTKLKEKDKEIEKKDKIIYEIAKSNVKLKGYDIQEEYIKNTISFYNKYVENLERNPRWRKEK